MDGVSVVGGGVSVMVFGAVTAVVETPGDVGVGGPAVVVAVDGFRFCGRWCFCRWCSAVTAVVETPGDAGVGGPAVVVL